jgi:hypothetical protein
MRRLFLAACVLALLGLPPLKRNARASIPPPNPTPIIRPDGTYYPLGPDGTIYALRTQGTESGNVQVPGYNGDGYLSIWLQPDTAYTFTALGLDGAAGSVGIYVTTYSASGDRPDPPTGVYPIDPATGLCTIPMNMPPDYTGVSFKFTVCLTPYGYNAQNTLVYGNAAQFVVTVASGLFGGTP